MNHTTGFYHLVALITAAIWGTTFISTKTLLHAGLTPASIFLVRFCLAYLLMWIFNPHPYQIKNWKDEIIMALLGITGGSLYFLTENTALKLTQASNVSLIVTTAPILTAIAAHLTVKGERLSRKLWIGAAIAMIGVALVVFNGQYVLKLHPAGDLLSLGAAICWAVYSVVLKRMGQRYSMKELTRNVFFYGVLTMIPWFCFEPFRLPMETLKQPVVWMNLLFLGIIASYACYMAWNISIKHLGTITTNNYIYFIPVVTLVASAIILHEKLTALALIGAALILLGVYWTEQGDIRILRTEKERTHKQNVERE